MRRETLEDVGLYDAMIIGGGDLAIVKAAVGQSEDLARHYLLGAGHRRHYLNWSQKFHRAIAGRIGVVPGTLHHLWHGDLINRQYRPRRSLLAQAEFDPYLDLALDANGSWRWNSDKPALHQQVKEYFQNRREDDSWQMPRAS